MVLDVFEFIRRFLLHVLPPKYFKIRYLGLFSNRNKKKKIKICREILGMPKANDELNKSLSWEELLFKLSTSGITMSKSRKCILLNSSLTGEDPRICPSCKKGQMIRKGELSSVRN